MKQTPAEKMPTTQIRPTDDEEQRRLLQKYIFELEEAHEKADEISIAHEQLKRSQDLLLTILSSTRQAICLIKDRKIIWCNKGITDVLGWEQEDLLGQSTKILFPSRDEFERIGALIYEEAYRDDPPPLEYEYVHRDGRKVPCLVTWRVVDRGDITKGYVFSIADFSENAKAREALRTAYEELEVRVEERTAQLADANRELLKEIEERRHAEEAAKRSEERYRTILDSMMDGYFEADLEGKLTFFNPVFCEMTGYSEDEMTGKNFEELADSDSRDMLFASFKKVRETRKARKVSAFQLLCKDGHRILVETPVSPILDGSGETIGFRGLARDVTEKKRLEARLQSAQQMEAIGSLAGGVAHDLNNILSGIVSYPELLLMDLPKESHLRTAVSAIKRSGEKAVAIVQDLLTLARRGVAEQEVANMNSLVTDYLESPEHNEFMSFHPGVRVEHSLEKELLDIYGSPVHLSKVVMNLVSNAAEAMPTGGVISISTQNKYVDSPIGDVEEVAEGDYAVLTVRDHGIGIAQEDRSRIFEPFYTKKKMGRSGTGLGMAVVWGVVKDHNGYIDLQSAKGKGTTIRLYFPRTWKTSRHDKAELSLEHYMGSGETVLIIDDVEDQRIIASIMLERLGYSVSSVSSGEEALAYLAEHSVDLLVLDMIMDPGMDGLETYEKVLKNRPEQKAVIASGFSETKRVRRALELGAGPYVKKPYSLEKLGLAVKDALNDQ
jgi:PAS domain S-box-containing protein